MPQISTCPTCQQTVTVPDGLAESAEVECPLCESRFSLTALTGEATEAADMADLPPELIPVTAELEGDVTAEPSDAEPKPFAFLSEELPAEMEAEEADNEAAAEEPTEEREEPGDEIPDSSIATEEPGDETEEAEPAEAAEETVPSEAGQDSVSAEETPESQSAEEDRPPQVRCPCCDAEFGLNQVILVGTGAELGLEAASAISAEGLVKQSPQAVGESLLFGLAGEVGEAPKIDLGAEFETRSAGEAGAFDFGSGEAEREGEGESAGTAIGAQRPRAKEKSLLRELIGIVLGGVAGVSLAYYGLNYFGGERFDFAEIYLPGIEHTYSHRPGWWPEWSGFRGGSESEEPQDSHQSGTEEAGTSAESSRAAGAEKADVGPPAAEKKAPSVEKSADTPKPKATTFPAGYVGLAESPSFTSKDLEAALKAAQEGFNSETLTPEAYEKFCRLAEVVTFVEPSGGGPLQDRLEAVRDLVRKLEENEANIDKIGQMAGKTALSRNRRSNGILLAGTVKRSTQQGKAHRTDVQLAAIGMPVVVISQKPLPAKKSDRALILGLIVDQPAEKLVGVETELPQVVWSRMTVKVKN